MIRVSWPERAWNASSMPVFLEKIVLPLCVVIVGLLVFTNPMSFDWTQRITGSLAIVFAAYFVAHSLHKPHPIGADPSDVTREYLPPEVNMQYLTGLYNKNTSLQADKLFSAYAGKWIKLSVMVTDTRSSGQDAVMIFSIYNGGGIGLTFGPAWRDRVAALPSGSEITVAGRLEKATSMAVLLTDCEIIAPQP